VELNFTCAVGFSTSCTYPTHSARKNRPVSRGHRGGVRDCDTPSWHVIATCHCDTSLWHVSATCHCNTSLWRVRHLDDTSFWHVSACATLL